MPDGGKAHGNEKKRLLVLNHKKELTMTWLDSLRGWGVEKSLLKFDNSTRSIEY